MSEIEANVTCSSENVLSFVSCETDDKVELIASKSHQPIDEFKRATLALKNLDELNRCIAPTLNVERPDNIDVQTWATIVSKLSGFLSNLVEISVSHWLNKNILDKDMEWKRVEGSFPDVQLYRKGVKTKYGLEVKVVCSGAQEASARFRHSREMLDEGSVLVCLFAWRVSDDGEVNFFTSWFMDAAILADIRDQYVTLPKGIYQWPDNSGQKMNTQQSDVRYLTLQNQRKYLVAASQMVMKWKEDNPCKTKPHEQKEIMILLGEKFGYKNDTNFGKLQRINDETLKKFLKQVRRGEN